MAAPISDATCRSRLVCGLPLRGAIAALAAACTTGVAGPHAPGALHTDEKKFIWIKMFRGIDGDKMRNAIDEWLAANVDEDTGTAIAFQVASLGEAFPCEVPRGANIGFWYQPGRGTVLQLGDVDKARMAGKAFMSALWSMWFGNKPADTDLMGSVLK